MASSGKQSKNYVQEAFDDLGITKAEFERRSGISQRTFITYLRGELPTRRDKRRQLCDGLGWTHDSIDRIETGQPPVRRPGEALVEDQTPAMSADQTIKELTAQVEQLTARVEALERILGRRALGEQSAMTFAPRYDAKSVG